MMAHNHYQHHPGGGEYFHGYCSKDSLMITISCVSSVGALNLALPKEHINVFTSRQHTGWFYGYTSQYCVCLFVLSLSQPSVHT